VLRHEASNVTVISFFTLGALVPVSIDMLFPPSFMMTIGAVSYPLLIG
jgi:hypothetical protein